MHNLQRRRQLAPARPAPVPVQHRLRHQRVRQRQPAPVPVHQQLRRCNILTV